MKQVEYKILEKSCRNLSNKYLIEHNELFLTDNFNIDDFNYYMNKKLFLKLNKFQLEILKSSTRKYNDSSFEPIVSILNGKIRIFVPKINTVRDALINVHEYTHAISIINKYNRFFHYSEKEEVMPMHMELDFLRFHNYKEEDLIYSKINDTINACNKLYQDNKPINFEEISHIYASLVLFSKIDKELDEDILFNNKSIEKNLDEHNIILTKKIFSDLNKIRNRK